MLTFTTSFAFGQGITMSEDTVYVGLNESYGYDALFFTNESSADIELAVAWEVNCLASSDPLKVQICFGDLCFMSVNEDAVWGDTGPTALVTLAPGEMSGAFKFTPFSSGENGSEYTLKIFDRNNPTTEGSTVFVYGEQCDLSSTDDFLLAYEDFNVYPNPAEDIINIDTPRSNKPFTVKIYNIIGRKVMDVTIDNTPINISELTSGIYTYQIVQDGRSTAARKLMIR